MIKGEIWSVFVEPLGDAPEFIGEFPTEWSKGAAAVGALLCCRYGKAQARQFSFTPSRLQAAMVKCDTA